MSKKLEWHTEKRKIGELLPYEFNPRRLTEKQYKDLKKSLEKFNLVEIPAIDIDGTILAGHQRIKILAELYGTDYEIDVRIPNRKLTEKEIQEYNIRSNKNTGEWDFEALANFFDVDDLLNWGFTEEELQIDLNIIENEEGKEEKENIINFEEEEKVIIKRGDLIELGQHRILCGDSTNKSDVDRLMNGEKADMVFTDPPYGMGKNIENDNLNLNTLSECTKYAFYCVL